MPTKAVATSPRTPTKASLTDAPTTNAVFGIVFDINGTSVSITTENLPGSDKPFVFDLPEDVRLGTIADFITWFNGQFGTSIPAASTFPAPLDAVIGKVNSLVFTIETLHIVIPESGSTDPNQYTLRMSAMWDAGDGIKLFPGLSIQGATFGVTNETPEA